jgi:hypothetical protein
MLIGVIGVVIGLLLAAAGIAVAGSLNPSAGPVGAASQMYTLQQIYDRLDTGAAGTKMTAFTEPSAGPTAGTSHTLDEIYALAQPRALAKRVAKTGQTTCYDAAGAVIPCAGTGQDGAYQMGIDPAIVPTGGPSGVYNTPAWTGVRFTDNGDGTVTDNLTALIWLKNANCFGWQTWATALTSANTLASGSCGLNDGSSAGQWRLPNVNELYSLIDLTQSRPPLPAGHPFTGVQPYFYWTSTTHADSPSLAWRVSLVNGSVIGLNKTNSFYVWPVRGG